MDDAKTASPTRVDGSILVVGITDGGDAVSRPEMRRREQIVNRLLKSQHTNESESAALHGYLNSDSPCAGS